MKFIRSSWQKIGRGVKCRDEETQCSLKTSSARLSYKVGLNVIRELKAVVLKRVSGDEDGVLPLESEKVLMPICEG